jgi:DNA mismatch repair protein MutS
VKTFNPKFMSNSCKLFMTELDEISSTLVINVNELNKKKSYYFKDYQNTFYKKYSHIFNSMKRYIELIDVSYSNIMCKNKYNYVCPILDPSNSAHFTVKGLRHPIIERLNIEYIPNDIVLNDESCGILLYGLNSSGKSSLLRSVGILIILAQAGLYVPCSYLKYSPFSTIVSQVDLTDDLYNGKSSFITEMIGLKRILQCSGPNTLVLSDELCRGSEFASAVSIVTATLLHLIKSNTKFFFTSHLHSISIHCSKIKISHLSVEIVNGNIIFNRKIQDGSGHSLYGLEVAENILENPEFIDNAFRIRNEITGNKASLLGSSSSHYNKKKIITKC